jgi:hypothetical protein
MEYDSNDPWWPRGCHNRGEYEVLKKLDGEKGQAKNG